MIFLVVKGGMRKLKRWKVKTEKVEGERWVSMAIAPITALLNLGSILKNSFFINKGISDPRVSQYQIP